MIESGACAPHKLHALQNDVCLPPPPPPAQLGPAPRQARPAPAHNTLHPAKLASLRLLLTNSQTRNLFGLVAHVSPSPADKQNLTSTNAAAGTRRRRGLRGCWPLPRRDRPALGCLGHDGELVPPHAAPPTPSGTVGGPTWWPHLTPRGALASCPAVPQTPHSQGCGGQPGGWWDCRSREETRGQKA